MARKTVGRPNQAAKFIGMDQVQAIYADSFVLLGVKERASLYIYFCQNQMPHTLEGEIGTVSTRLPNKAVACIAVTNQTAEAMVRAMAENMGYTLQPIEQEPQEEGEA